MSRATRAPSEQPDECRAGDLELLEDVDHVVAVTRDERRRVESARTPAVAAHQPVGVGERSPLRLPNPAVRDPRVKEDNRRPGTRDLVVQTHEPDLTMSPRATTRAWHQAVSVRATAGAWHRGSALGALAGDADVGALGSVGSVPELPEVETVRRRLAPLLEGRAVLRRRDLRRSADAAVRSLIVARELDGERVRSLGRRGKYLLINFESGRALVDPSSDDGIAAAHPRWERARCGQVSCGHQQVHRYRRGGRHDIGGVPPGSTTPTCCCHV